MIEQEQLEEAKQQYRNMQANLQLKGWGQLEKPKDRYILWCDGQEADSFPSLRELNKAFAELEQIIRHGEWYTGEKLAANSWAWSINNGPRIPISQ